MNRAIIGKHPAEHAYGVSLSACNKQTDSGFQHRELTENGKTDSFLAHTVNVLRTHHLSDEQIISARYPLTRIPSNKLAIWIWGGDPNPGWRSGSELAI